AGVVVDDAGKPFPEAQLVVQRRTGTDPQGRRQHESLDISDADIATHRLDGGRFEVRGGLPEGELALLARHPDAVALPPVPFARGEPELRVVLARGGSIKVSVLLDAGLPTGDVRLSLRAAGAGDARDVAPRGFDWGNGPQGKGPLTRTWRGL